MQAQGIDLGLQVESLDGITCCSMQAAWFEAHTPDFNTLSLHAISANLTQEVLLSLLISPHIFKFNSLEALASAGGILEDGKAFKIKLIRKNKDLEKPALVYLMDLSTIQGIRDGNSIVQAGDIIYVEPRYRPVYVFTRELAPVVTLITSVLILFQFAILVSR